MSEYVIGDLHGCYQSWVKLLDAIQFNEKTDKLWLCGDIVARGDNSLDTLRLVKYLVEQKTCQMVLGNHDITLIAVWRGIIKRKDKDKTAAIFKAKDKDELLDWLRKQPLLLTPNDKTVLVHAGIPPIWTLKMAQQYAKKAEERLGGSLNDLDEMLSALYNKSFNFDDFSKLAQGMPVQLSQMGKMKLTVDYLTRMRLCKKTGEIDMEFKGGLGDNLPREFKAWFDWHGQIAMSGRKILFGHWAALEGKVATQYVQSLDGGCVWGGRLMAYRLDDESVVSVDCHR